MSRIKKTELKRIVDSYEAIFQGWERISGDAFFRASGPFAQQIWFEDLSGGDYRPANSVTTLFDGCYGASAQFLTTPGCREISPLDHERKFAKVCDAIMTQFNPSVAQPFDEYEAMRIFEAFGTDRIKFASPLAYLCAYYGDLNKATSLIATVRNLAKNNLKLYDWEVTLVNAIESLAIEIGNGSQEAFLAKSREVALAEWYAPRKPGER